MKGADGEAKDAEDFQLELDGDAEQGVGQADLRVLSQRQVGQAPRMGSTAEARWTARRIPSSRPGLARGARNDAQDAPSTAQVDP